MPQYAIVQILDDKSIPWFEFVKSYLASAEKRMRPATVNTLIIPTIKSFSAYVGVANLQDITPSMISDWSAGIDGTANTIGVRINTIRFILNHAVKLGLIRENPAKLVPRPKMQFTGRAPSDEEWSAFLPLLPPVVNRAARFMLYTGLRPGEMLSLEWPQINGDELLITAIKSKSKKDRTVPLSPSALSLIQHNGKRQVFKISRSTLEVAFRKASKLAGVGRITAHACRHTAVTRFLEKTGDTEAAMEIFGWTNASSMRPYRHITETRKRLIDNISYSIAPSP